MDTDVVFLITSIMNYDAIHIKIMQLQIANLKYIVCQE